MLLAHCSKSPSATNSNFSTDRLLKRYVTYRPDWALTTSPQLFKQAKWFETLGWLRPVRSTISLTVSGLSRNISSIVNLEWSESPRNSFALTAPLEIAICMPGFLISANNDMIASEPIML
jgi:hypothetical protein